MDENREKELVKAVEAKFSPKSLYHRKFMRDLIENGAGWVDLGFVTEKFGDIKLKCTDPFALAKLLSKHSALLEVGTGAHAEVRLRENPVYPDEDDVHSRTVYAEFLPRDSTMKSLAEFFGKIGHVSWVTLPTFKGSRQLKGYAFVEYDTVEDAVRASEELDEFHTDPNAEKPALRVITYAQWEALRDEYLEARSQFLVSDEQLELVKQPAVPRLPKVSPLSEPGVKVVHLTDVPFNATIQDIQSLVDSLELTALYIDHWVGDDQSWVRFASASEARRFAGRVEREGSTLAGSTFTATVLDPDEESSYMEYVEHEKQRVRERTSRLRAHSGTHALRGGRGRNWRGGRGGGGRGRGRRGGGGRGGGGGSWRGRGRGRGGGGRGRGGRGGAPAGSNAGSTGGPAIIRPPNRRERRAAMHKDTRAPHGKRARTET